MDDRLIWKALQFAAEAHRHQHRKGADRSPYINHCIEVAHRIRIEGGTDDPEILAAALLHDVVEDTSVTLEEVGALFGPRVQGLVDEMSDDMNLSSAERKQLQENHAPGLSPDARLLKLADKIANLEALATVPPIHWSAERQQAYLDWACRVASRVPDTGTALEQSFEEIRQKAQDAIDRRKD